MKYSSVLVHCDADWLHQKKKKNVEQRLLFLLVASSGKPTFKATSAYSMIIPIFYNISILIRIMECLHIRSLSNKVG